MMFYFILTAHYILIKQNFVSKKLDRLVGKLFKSKTGPGQFLRQFDRISSEILALYLEIRVQNRFWSKYVTAYFVVYIMEVCYMGYAFLFIPNSSGAVRFFFAFFALYFVLVLLVLTYECSCIVHRNRAILAERRLFTKLYQQRYKTVVQKLLKVYSFPNSYIQNHVILNFWSPNSLKPLRPIGALLAVSHSH